MIENYRGNLLKFLPSRLKIAGLQPGATASEFLTALETGKLLGVSVPEDVMGYLTCYTIANIRGGEKLNDFTANVTAKLPETFFDRVLNPNPDKERPTVSDTMYVVRIAVAQLGLKLNGENSGGGDLSQLPLAV